MEVQEMLKILDKLIAQSTDELVRESLQLARDNIFIVSDDI